MTYSHKVIDTRSTNPVKSGISVAQQVIDELAQHGLEAAPQNYAVFYSYLTEENAELVAEINELKSRNRKINEDTARYLHQRYLSTDHKDQEAIAEKTQDAMDRVLRMVDRLATETTEHNHSLGKQTDTLSNHIEGNEALEDLLGDVVKQLKEIHTTNQEFSGGLATSQQEVRQLKANLDKLTNEARLDFLTNVKNRRAFDEHMIELVQKAKEEEGDLCLLLLDIDHFKKFNDTYGHQIGDEVLKVVAGALKRTVRGQDIVARYGGEEFAVILPETPARGAEIVAENIRKLIAQNRLRKRNSSEELSPITVSIGVSRYHYHDNDSIPEMIERADSALYRAKAQGRNRVVLDI